jgi:hypothetical protein
MAKFAINGGTAVKTVKEKGARVTSVPDLLTAYAGKTLLRADLEKAVYDAGAILWLGDMVGIAVLDRMTDGLRQALGNKDIVDAQYLIVMRTNGEVQINGVNLTKGMLKMLPELATLRSATQLLMLEAHDTEAQSAIDTE